MRVPIIKWQGAFLIVKERVIMSLKLLSVVLFLIFLVLKLCSVIAWSWWWVTSPLWICFIVIMLSVFFVAWYANTPRGRLWVLMNQRRK